MKHLFAILFLLAALQSGLSEQNNKWKKYKDLIKQAEKDHSGMKKDYDHLDVIEKDLRVWRERGGITKDDMKKALERSVHYQIIDHKLYRQKDCTFSARCHGIEHFILQIIDDLPDMEMAINVHDWPKSARYTTPMPVLSFSKVNQSHWDVMYPAWTFWEGGPAVWPLYPTGLGRWDLFRKDLNKMADKTPWEEKDNKGFFRGSRTTAERDPLVLLSRRAPDLVDAQYTKNQAWKSKKDTLGEDPAKEVHLNEHCQYKYLFNFRGVAASFRLKHLFLCRSLVFHVGEDWLEFFYPGLKPWYHYIPVSVELTEAEELLEFAKDNDALMKKIANRGRDFIWNNLRMKTVSTYWRKLLQSYSSLLSYKVEKVQHYKEVVGKDSQGKKRRKHNEL